MPGVLEAGLVFSQTRLTRQTYLLSHLDLQLNLLAEQESTKTLKVLYAIAEHFESSQPSFR